jgi:predicted component of type VI protein secretion system
MTKKETTTPKTASEQPRPSASNTLPNKNPNLDSFEAVMQAMDAELSRLRQPGNGSEPQPPTNKDKGKARAVPDMDMDIETSMQAELDSLMEQEDAGDSDGEMEETGMDYNLIKNFLESFKSQAGLPGPVGNLAGRLQPGWTLPRDES